MKKQTIAVQCQSQTTCLCILHYHLQQKNIQAFKKGAAHAKKGQHEKVVKSKVVAQKWL